mmetsp:Transcript_11075/g.18103  ORF Transcript_11075/g.18103 Transcript_11075/m.18103 type:complete len:343 (-) Transcript_11075:1531-2559(-)
MPASSRIAAFLILLCFLCKARGTIDCSWASTSAPSGSDWIPLNANADGQYVTAAVYGGKIYYSHDFGTSWIASNSVSADWHGIAMSDSGEYQYGAVRSSGGYIYYSTDYGVTWTQSSSIAGVWSVISTEASGQYVIAGLDSNSDPIGKIYYSSNYGVNWLQSNSLVARWLFGMAMDSSGTTAIAVPYGGYVYKSTDYGATWTQAATSVSGNYFSASLSSSGQYGAVGMGPGSIYISSDYGDTWTQSSIAPGGGVGLTSLPTPQDVTCRPYSQQRMVATEKSIRVVISVIPGQYHSILPKTSKKLQVHQMGYCFMQLLGTISSTRASALSLLHLPRHNPLHLY